MARTLIDLTEDAAFFRVLLSDTLAWRERLVERFIFGSGNHVRVTSTYQCELPPDLVKPFLPKSSGATGIRALVPVTSRPKEPVLGFDLRGPGDSQGHLLRRSDIAALEAGYITEAISTSTARETLDRGVTGDLAEAICAFTPGLFSRMLRDRRRPSGLDARAAALSEYLAGSLKLVLSPAEVATWLMECDRVADRLCEVLDEPRDHASSSECVLLALPLMEDPPRTGMQVDEVVRSYAAAIDAAWEMRDLAVLQALADYGRRWELVAEVEVPLGEPWLVKVSEDRPLRLASGRSSQTVALGDAKSVHFEVSVPDPGISLREGRHSLTTSDDGELNFGEIEDVRETSESMSIYTSQEGRETYYAKWTIAFSRPFYVRLALWLVLGLVVVSMVVAMAVDEDSLAEKLAVITVPTTFAATFLLLREGTTLAAKLDRLLRIALAIGTAILWTIVAVRLLCMGTVF
jgi:hypothetical protein